MQILNDLFKMGRKVIRRKLSLRLTEDEVALIRDSLGRIRYYKNLYGRYKHVVKDLEISPFGYSALEDEIEAKNRRTGSREIETVRKTGRVSQNEMTAFAR